jgi:hypothetical protein
MGDSPMWWALGGGCLSSLVIAWQDFRHREIHLVPVGLFLISGLAYRLSQDRAGFWESPLLNLLLIGIIFLVILLFYRIKGERQVMDSKLGWGDVVIWLCLAFWMDTPVFILFFATCMILLTLIVGILLGAGYIDTRYPIPLAGSMCLAFVVFFPAWHYLPPSWINLWT